MVFYTPNRQAYVTCVTSHQIMLSLQNGWRVGRVHIIVLEVGLDTKKFINIAITNCLKKPYC